MPPEWLRKEKDMLMVCSKCKTTDIIKPEKEQVVAYCPICGADLFKQLAAEEKIQELKKPTAIGKE